MNILLASTSLYRKQLLQRLHISFQCIAPETDETPRPGEAPAELAERLALAKASAVAARFPDALVIGSDQAASLDGALLEKPGSVARAQAQLRASSGRNVLFHTGLAVVCRGREIEKVHVESFQAQFRELSDAEIRRYVELDQPLDCAGSFKVESLGIALFDELSGADPTSLEGLPLISLSAMLRDCGENIP